MLKITYITNNAGFCKFYRILYPAENIAKNNMANVSIIHPTNYYHMKQYISVSDVVVFQHGVTGEFIIEVCDFIKKNKIQTLVVCDYDDDIKNSNPINMGAYTYWGTKEIKSKDGKRDLYKDGQHGFNIKENIKRVSCFEDVNKKIDLITVTTKELAEAYQVYGTKVDVFPNLLNTSLMPKKKFRLKKDDIIRIVWQGGDSHFEDLMLVMPALTKIKKIYGKKVEFYLLGITYKTLTSLVNAKKIPWTDPELFFAKFSEYDFDIGIIPIADNVFNRGKSNIKWLEYSYYNIPSVVQNNIPYKQHITDGVNGLLFKNNDELYDRLSLLIDHESVRIKISQNANRTVLDNYTLQSGNKAKLLLDIYENHLNNKIKEYNT